MPERLELRASLSMPVALGILALAVGVMVVIPATAVRVIMPCIAIAMLWLAVRLAKRRLELDASGITSIGVFSTTTMSWDDVDHYTFFSRNQQYSGAVAGGGLAGAAVIMLVVLIASVMRKKGPANRRFDQGRMTLVGADGRRIAIDPRFRDATQALDMAFAEVHARLTKREARFEPFALTATELSHKRKGTLGLADIAKVSAAGSRIAIRRRGKRLAWAAAPMNRVHNSILFLELLAESGVAVTAQDEVFMPPSIADKLRAAVARQQALPTARVVVRD